MHRDLGELEVSATGGEPSGLAATAGPLDDLERIFGGDLF